MLHVTVQYMMEKEKSLTTYRKFSSSAIAVAEQVDRLTLE